MTSLILLRTPLQPLSSDPYHRYLTSPSSSYTPHHLPVLTTSFHTSQLTSILPRLKDKYAGVIITSGRSVDAIAKASEDVDTEWDVVGMRFFVVGTSTKSQLERLLKGEEILGAEESGTGEKLAHFIEEYYSSHIPTKPLLYLVGDKNSTTIEDILVSSGIAVERLMVYSTTVRDDFEGTLGELLSSGEGGRKWIAAFSPSGAKTLFIILRKLGHFPPKADDATPISSPLDPCQSSSPPAACQPSSLPSLISSASQNPSTSPQIRIAAIGPTTSTYILTSEQYTCDAVAERPEVESLVDALKEADRLQKVSE